ncbi:hypothetical protein ABAC460_21615 [Asticcacaulis sp. AC460]|uniref:hypothetical protein n=1 Tax=Asticcacaulis sp. AC460 TaxID=1282360 RepID=UPI0003C3EC7A|nr:hypothetical protein [Asticcacaulis sp. AC460]ESQ86981.1 hypothetical protein ABAC460_21615 [Asticcacaulis sp. AC460]
MLYLAARRLFRLPLLVLAGLLTLVLFVPAAQAKPGARDLQDIAIKALNDESLYWAEADKLTAKRKLKEACVWYSRTNRSMMIADYAISEYLLLPDVPGKPVFQDGLNNLRGRRPDLQGRLTAACGNTARGMAYNAMLSEDKAFNGNKLAALPGERATFTSDAWQADFKIRDASGYAQSQGYIVACEQYGEAAKAYDALIANVMAYGAQHPEFDPIIVAAFAHEMAQERAIAVKGAQDVCGRDGFGEQITVAMKSIQEDVEEGEAALREGDRLLNAGEREKACGVFVGTRPLVNRMLDNVIYWNERIPGHESHPQYHGFVALSARAEALTDALLPRLTGLCKRSDS